MNPCTLFRRQIIPGINPIQHQPPFLPIAKNIIRQRQLASPVEQARRTPLIATAKITAATDTIATA